MATSGLFNRQGRPLSERPGGEVRRAWERLGRHRATAKKAAVTLIFLAGLYYGVTTVVAWITAPRIDMTMSPVAGPIAVTAEPAKLAPIEGRVTYTGSVAPYREVTVYPRVEGWVEQFTLYEGDSVREGQVIARLDRTELTAQVARATASLEEAQATVAFWNKELPRLQKLFSNGAIPESDADNAARQERMARGAVGAQEAEIKRLSTVLSYTDVAAPISGQVSKRYIYAGILVKPNMPIVDLQDLSRVRVQIHVAETDMRLVRPGTPAIVRVGGSSGPQAERHGTVTTIFPELDPTARTATVEVVLPNPDGVLRSEMYAVMDLVLARKPEAIVIPGLAVIEGPDKQPLVYVTDGVTAFSRPVKLGIAEGDRVEVVQGLKEGEMVIWKGQRSLTDGAPVNLVSAS